MIKPGKYKTKNGSIITIHSSDSNEDKNFLYANVRYLDNYDIKIFYDTEGKTVAVTFFKPNVSYSRNKGTGILYLDLFDSYDIIHSVNSYYKALKIMESLQ